MEGRQAIYKSINDVVKTTGLSEYFLRKLHKQGQLPCITSGRKIYVNVSKLLEQLEQQNTLK